jgi:hypothetical protein
MRQNPGKPGVSVVEPFPGAHFPTNKLPREEFLSRGFLCQLFRERERERAELILFLARERAVHSFVPTGGGGGVILADWLCVARCVYNPNFLFYALITEILRGALCVCYRVFISENGF